MVKRYNPCSDRGASWMHQIDDGDYVSHEDYAALLAKYEKAVEAMNKTVRAINYINTKGTIGWSTADALRDFLEANK